MIRIMPRITVPYIKQTRNLPQIMNDTTISDNEDDPRKQNITTDDSDRVEVKSGEE